VPQSYTLFNGYSRQHANTPTRQRLCTKYSNPSKLLSEKGFFSRKGAKKTRRNAAALCAFAPLREKSSLHNTLCKAHDNSTRWPERRRFEQTLVQLEAAHGVFADAAEIEGAVVFEDVGDFGVAVGRVVLEVFDYAATLVQAKDE